MLIYKLFTVMISPQFKKIIESIKLTEPVARIEFFGVSQMLSPRWSPKPVISGVKWGSYKWLKIHGFAWIRGPPYRKQKKHFYDMEQVKSHHCTASL